MNKDKKFLALLMIVIVSFLLFNFAFELLPGITGAVVLYVVFNRAYKRLAKLIKLKGLSATLIIILSFILFVVPLIFVSYVAIAEFIKILQSPWTANIITSLNFTYENFDLQVFIQEHIEVITSTLKDISATAVGTTMVALSTTIYTLVNLFVMYMLLFFLLINNEKVKETMVEIAPFGEKNSNKLIKEMHNVIRATIESNGIVSLVLGFLFAAGLMIIGFDNIIFWFFIATILSFIPIVGIQFIWIPVGAMYIYSGDHVSGIGIIIWGAFLSYIADGYIRQNVQNRIAKIHPFVSLMGLILGISYFGIVGIIVGPLVLSFFILMIKMFKDEYLPNW
ncbi:AI-2E family transporter [Patescibacteria group bacterium]|nr:AI-2E family transporter [Patescibacteria group bacterium]